MFSSFTATGRSINPDYQFPEAFCPSLGACSNIFDRNEEKKNIKGGKQMENQKAHRSPK